MPREREPADHGEGHGGDGAAEVGDEERRVVEHRGTVSDGPRRHGHVGTGQWAAVVDLHAEHGQYQRQGGHTKPGVSGGGVGHPASVVTACCGNAESAWPTP